MYRTTRTRLEELNHHIVCVLCGGYFIDATSIIECLHSFCRTCIVRYLESSKYCPICDVQVHKTRPLLNIRSDKTLQTLVYKLVPGLHEDEMRRRRMFYITHGEDDGEVSLETRGDSVMEEEGIREDDNISVCLDMSSNGQLPDDRDDSDNKPVDRRYLLCPSSMTVLHLKKFIRLKFQLPIQYKIYLYHTDELLVDNFTLLDVAYIYTWRRKKPLRLFYVVDDNPRTTRVTVGTPVREMSKPNQDNIPCPEDTSQPAGGGALSDEKKTVAQVELCDATEMLSDISDYEPSLLSDYSQQIHVTSAGSDSTVTFTETEDALPRGDSSDTTAGDTQQTATCDARNTRTDNSRSNSKTVSMKPTSAELISPPSGNFKNLIDSSISNLMSVEGECDTKESPLTYVPNGLSKDTERKRLHIDSHASSLKRASPAKIWKKRNGVSSVRSKCKDSIGTSTIQSGVGSLSTNNGKHVSNGNANRECHIQNGHHKIAFPSEQAKSEPLDLSDNASKKRTAAHNKVLKIDRS